MPVVSCIERGGTGVLIQDIKRWLVTKPLFISVSIVTGLILLNSITISFCVNAMKGEIYPLADWLFPSTDSPERLEAASPMIGNLQDWWWTSPFQTDSDDLPRPVRFAPVALDTNRREDSPSDPGWNGFAGDTSITGNRPGSGQL